MATTSGEASSRMTRGWNFFHLPRSRLQATRAESKMRTPARVLEAHQVGQDLLRILQLRGQEGHLVGGRLRAMITPLRSRMRPRGACTICRRMLFWSESFSW